MSPQPAAESAATHWPSLRRRILRHVIVPLAVVWVVGSTLLTLTSAHFTGRAFDRSLLDDAFSLASHVRRAGDRLQVDLLPRELTTLLFDQSEIVFFAIWDGDGRLVAGHGGLVAAELPEGVDVRFVDNNLRGHSLRSVTLRQYQPEAFTVVMAQTRQSRDGLLHALLLYLLVPQALLLGALAWWLWSRVGRDVQPLSALQGALDRRDAADLRAIPVTAGVREVRRVTEALNALFERVGHSLTAQREFVGNVAHELRTPLAGIRALADYGLSRDDPAVWREQLRRIVASQERVSHLVDQLLALAMADEGAITTTPVELGALARQLVLDALPRADAAGVDLGGVGFDRPAWVQGHELLIAGVLTNLLDNALRHAAAVPQPVVTVAVEMLDDGRVGLCVGDNGPGLAAPDRERLQARWSRGADLAQAPHAGSGAGLGLAIVRRYAGLLGAEFRLEAGMQGGLSARLLFAPAGPCHEPVKPAG